MTDLAAHGIEVTLPAGWEGRLFKRPSAGDVANLVATIKREGVKTIFAESSVNPKVEAAIARETGAKIGPALWADSLGPKGSDGATYIASIAANTRALVQGFTGGAVDCPVDA